MSTLAFFFNAQIWLVNLKSVCAGGAALAVLHGALQGDEQAG